MPCPSCINTKYLLLKMVDCIGRCIAPLRTYYGTHDFDLHNYLMAAPRARYIVPLPTGDSFFARGVFRIGSKRNSANWINRPKLRSRIQFAGMIIVGTAAPYPAHKAIGCYENPRTVLRQNN
jgi:hypothetical protein